MSFYILKNITKKFNVLKLCTLKYEKLTFLYFLCVSIVVFIFLLSLCIALRSSIFQLSQI